IINRPTVVPSGDLTCLFATATIDESKLRHRRLGHVNFKTMNKLVKGNLVRGYGYRWQSQTLRYHGGAPAQTRSNRVLEKPNEPPLLEGHTSRSREGRMEHQFELTDNVIDLEKEKDSQAVEILRLKKRVKRLERQRKSSTSQPRRRKYRQVESSDYDLNEDDASK
ncbi:ribonuclease H-like domain-containing protein, partial [Tanacetum coccineum]